MLDKETLGERIKRLRKKAGLTQESLSEILDLSYMTIRRWEWGKVIPRLSEIKALATALHVSEDELLNGVPEQNAWVLHVEIGNTKEDFLDMAKKESLKKKTLIKKNVMQHTNHLQKKLVKV